jgi:hypothetical protein
MSANRIDRQEPTPRDKPEPARLECMGRRLGFMNVIALLLLALGLFAAAFGRR